MKLMSTRRERLALCAILALPLSAGPLFAQETPPDPPQQTSSNDASVMTVVGNPPEDLTGLPEGPEVEGHISARRGNTLHVTSADGKRTPLYISEATKVSAKGGFFLCQFHAFCEHFLAPVSQRQASCRFDFRKSFSALIPA